MYSVFETSHGTSLSGGIMLHVNYPKTDSVNVDGTTSFLRLLFAC